MENNKAEDKIKKEENRSKNNIVQKLIAASVIGITLIILSAAYVLYQNNKERIMLLSHENSDLVFELSARDSVINELVGEFESIENTISIIKEKRNLLTNVSGESDMNKSRKEAIIHDIQVLNSLIDESKSKINQLNKRLRESGMKIKEFENKIAELEIRISKKVEDIALLKEDLVTKNFKISELDKRVDTLEHELMEKTSFIAIQQEELSLQKHELNKGYYVQGDFKELKDKGLVKKEGGFLFLGRNKNLNNSLTSDNFKKVDISETNMIPIHAKKAKLISNHPDNSFNLIKEGKEVAYLKIEDPKEFWKISKYLVVETQN